MGAPHPLVPLLCTRSTGDEYRSGNKLWFVWLPIAEAREDGTPVMNPHFVEAFTTKFVNKMSRVILCCQDGGARTEIAASLLTEAGFTSIAVVEGGMDAYLAVSPLTDKARVWPEPSPLQRARCALLHRTAAPTAHCCCPLQQWCAPLTHACAVRGAQDKKVRIAKVVQPDSGVKYSYGNGQHSVTDDA